MNSIKNAIVTVTLLAVGYGSYIVLSEPGSNAQYVGQSVQNNAVVEPFAPATELAPNLEVRATPTPAPFNEQQPIAISPPVSVAAPNLRAPASSEIDSILQLPEVEPQTLPAFPDAQLPKLETAKSDTPVLQIDLPPKQDSSASNGLPELPALPDLIGSENKLPTETPTFPSNLAQSGVQSSATLEVELPPQPEAIVDVGGPALGAPEIGTPFDRPVSNLIKPEGIESIVQPAVSGQPELIEPYAAESDVEVTLPNNGGPFDTPVGRTATTLVPPNNVATNPPLEVNLQPARIDHAVGPIPPTVPEEGSAAFEKVWLETQELILVKDVAKALRILTPWCADSNLNDEQNERCLRLLDELAGEVVYSRNSYLEPAYTVRAGETLDEISKTYNVPLALVAKINGIAPPYALSTGESLKMIRGPFRADVSISNKELTLYVGAYYAGRFSVEIGRDLPPEETFYEVAEKTMGRNYFDRRTGSEVLRGQPDNRYGDHWLGLRGEHITTGHSVGIHGRPAAGVGSDPGCVSLDQIDAADVFSIMSIGSRVQIRR